MSCQKKLRSEYIYQIYHGGLICYLCGELILSAQELSLDHKKPRSKGGTSSRDNLAPTHKKCNCEKDNLTIEEFVILKSSIAAMAM